MRPVGQRVRQHLPHRPVEHRAVVVEQIDLLRLAAIDGVLDRPGVEPGDQVDLERVLLVADGDEIIVGMPLVAGAKIQATVVDQVKGPKVVVFRYKPKKRIRVKTGHRQKYTRLQIDSIVLK